MPEVNENTATAAELEGQQQALMRQAVAGAPMTRVQTDYQTTVAVLRPRNLRQIEAKIIEEASLAGSSCYYSWEVKNSDGSKSLIEGISYKGATILARNWGNITVKPESIQEIRGGVIFTAVVVDHETNATFARQFRLSSDYPVHGRMDQHRKDDVRFQIGQSKALRNVVLAYIPDLLQDRLLEHAKRGEREKIMRWIKREAAEHKTDENGGRIAIAKRIVAALGKEGVDEKRVLAKMGRTTVEALTIEDLVILKGNLDALRSQQETPETLFPVSDPTPPSTNGGSRSEEIQRKLREGGEGSAGQPKTGGDGPADSSAAGQAKEAGAAPPGAPASSGDPHSSSPPQATGPAHGDRRDGNAFERWCSTCNGYVHVTPRSRQCPTCKTPWKAGTADGSDGQEGAEGPQGGAPGSPPQGEAGGVPPAPPASPDPAPAGTHSYPELPADTEEAIKAVGVKREVFYELRYRFEHLPDRPNGIAESWKANRDKWMAKAKDEAEAEWIETVYLHYAGRAAATGLPQQG